MMLSEEQYSQIRAELDDCVRPLIFFHDDPDGLASFLLFYRYKGDGKGVPVKTTPLVDLKFLPKVEEYQPDKIFIVDLAMVDQDFLDAVNVPVVWVDHHQPLDRKGVKYFNPRIGDPSENLPASYLCYRVVKQDMWVSAVGCIGDWFFPPFADEFREEFEDLLPKEITKPEDALFNSRLGELVKIVSFILKGKISDVMKCVKIMTRIQSPYEILDQTTAQGKFLFKRASQMMADYDRLLEEASASVTDDQLLVFTYVHDKFSYTKELANEILYRFPDKRLIIGRIHDGKVKCSLRGSGVMLPDVLEKALVGIDGYGGGHEYACGACIAQDDFNTFVTQFREHLND